MRNFFFYGPKTTETSSSSFIVPSTFVRTPKVRTLSGCQRERSKTGNVWERREIYKKNYYFKFLSRSLKNLTWFSIIHIGSWHENSYHNKFSVAPPQLLRELILLKFFITFPLVYWYRYGLFEWQTLKCFSGFRSNSNEIHGKISFSSWRRRGRRKRRKWNIVYVRRREQCVSQAYPLLLP